MLSKNRLINKKNALEDNTYRYSSIINMYLYTHIHEINTYCIYHCVKATVPEVIRYLYFF